MEQKYFTPREIAKRLRVDYATVMRWIKTGLLPAETIREGKRNRHPLAG
jgi:excisionase family DNA binding protein